ncbi:Uma2 family endonuclease [Lentzea sp. NPDC059081]|uniref:Uma2 family endonuclease n=1 Tax=Lentzea sp. NPDC059081 TaxID=3346719 RepID=UPI003677178E
MLEGRLMACPNPLATHNVAAMNLVVQLSGQLPDELEVIHALDVNLELAPPGQPGFVRRPDLIVVRRSRRSSLVTASEVVLVAEVLSPGSRYTDRRAKRAEYADAGIPFYWMIDLDKPVSLAAMRLAGEFGYQEAPAETRIYEAVEPFPLKIQVDRLTD